MFDGASAGCFGRIDQLRQAGQCLARPAGARQCAVEAERDGERAAEGHVLDAAGMADQHDGVGPRLGRPQMAAAGDLLGDERRHRNAGQRDLAAEAPAAPGDQQRRFDRLACDEIDRAGRPGGKERLAAVAARHGAQAMIGRDRLDHPPAQVGQPRTRDRARPPAARTPGKGRCRRSASDTAPVRPARSRAHKGLHCLAADAAAATGVGARSQYSRKPSLITGRETATVPASTAAS